MRNHIPLLCLQVCFDLKNVCRYDALPVDGKEYPLAETQKLTYHLCILSAYPSNCNVLAVNRSVRTNPIRSSFWGRDYLQSYVEGFIQIPADEEVEWKAGAGGMVLSDGCHFSSNNVNTSAYNVIPVSLVN